MTLKTAAGSFVVLFVILIVLVIALGLGGKTCSYACDQSSAEDELRDFLAKTYTDKIVLGASCVRMDSDGDGYVSCTARVKGKEPNAAEETLPLECVGAATPQSGCRLQRTGVVVNR